MVMVMMWSLRNVIIFLIAKEAKNEMSKTFTEGILWFGKAIRLRC